MILDHVGCLVHPFDEERSGWPQRGILDHVNRLKQMEHDFQTGALGCTGSEGALLRKNVLALLFGGIVLSVLTMKIVLTLYDCLAHFVTFRSVPASKGTLAGYGEVDATAHSGYHKNRFRKTSFQSLKVPPVKIGKPVARRKGKRLGLNG